MKTHKKTSDEMINALFNWHLLNADHPMDDMYFFIKDLEFSKLEKLYALHCDIKNLSHLDKMMQQVIEAMAFNKSTEYLDLTINQLECEIRSQKNSKYF